MKITNYYLRLKNVYRKLRNKLLYIRRSKYLNDLSIMITEDTSIISSNCFAGRILQDLGRVYNTPTLGLYFWAPDYIEFLSHLKHYLTESKIEFVKQSKYELGNIRRAECPHWYPIGLLDGKVEIHFLHYHTEEEAAEKWYRRSKRVNFDNLFVIGMDQNLGTEKEMYDFDKLPYENKIYFSRYLSNVPSNVYMIEFKDSDSVGDAYRKGHLYYKRMVSHFNRKIRQ